MNAFLRWSPIVAMSFLAITSEADIISKTVVSPRSGVISTAAVLDLKRKTRSRKWSPPLFEVNARQGTPAGPTVIPILQNRELLVKPRFGFGSDWTPESEASRAEIRAPLQAAPEPSPQFVLRIEPSREYYSFRPYRTPYLFGPQYGCGSRFFSLNFGY